MEIRSSEEARKGVEDFALRFLELQLRKKEIDMDIKALKQECNEEGVPASKVTSLLNKIKAMLKKSDSERFEDETMTEWLESNSSITDKLQELNAK